MPSFAKPIPFLPEEKLASLRERFASVLPERIAELQAALDEVAAGATIEHLERLFHRLAGSAGSYGLPAVSVIAADGERACGDESRPWEERIATISSAIERLRAHVARGVR